MNICHHLPILISGMMICLVKMTAMSNLMQDLVEHCLQMQNHHRARIQALEDRLEGYGYKRPTEDHEMEVEEAPCAFGEQPHALCLLACI